MKVTTRAPAQNAGIPGYPNVQTGSGRQLSTDFLSAPSEAQRNADSLRVGPSNRVMHEIPVAGLFSGAADFWASDWDALVEPAGFYNSHAWIRGLEFAYGASPVLAATASARLTGLIPTWKNTEPAGLFDLAELTRGLPGRWDRKVLWLGTRRGTLNTITCTPEPDMRRRTLNVLLESARHLARAQGLSSAVWPYLTGKAAQEIASCHPRAQVILHSADASIKVPADGMRGMVSAARSRDRKEWNREQRIFRDSGGSVEWVALSPRVCDLVAPLLARTRDKYGSSGGIAAMRRTLSGQFASGVAKDALVALGRTGAKVTAAAVFYRRDLDHWLYGRYWGKSENAPRYAYHVLTCYEPINWAAQNGFNHLHLSVPATQSKISRGARVSPLALVVIPSADAKVIDDQILRRHNERLAQKWVRSVSSLRRDPDAIWAPWTTRTGG